jgi:hypothetical protein
MAEAVMLVMEKKIHDGERLAKQTLTMVESGPGTPVQAVRSEDTVYPTG